MARLRYLKMIVLSIALAGVRLLLGPRGAHTGSGLPKQQRSKPLKSCHSAKGKEKNGQKPHGNNISHQRDCAVWPLRQNCPPRRKQLSLAPNSHRLALTHCNTPRAGGHGGSDHPRHKTKTKAKIDMG